MRLTVVKTWSLSLQLMVSLLFLPPTVSTVSMKAADMSAQFTIQIVSAAETKFYYCVAALSQLQDLIRFKPAIQHYEMLKSMLICLNTLKDNQCFLRPRFPFFSQETRSLPT